MPKFLVLILLSCIPWSFANAGGSDSETIFFRKMSFSVVNSSELKELAREAVSVELVEGSTADAVVIEVESETGEQGTVFSTEEALDRDAPELLDRALISI